MFKIKYFKNCCKNTTLYKKSINLIFFALISSFFLNSCGLMDAKKEEGKKKEEEIVKKKDWEANVFKRVDQNKGDGIILFGKSKNETSAGNNIIWQASLQALQDIPLAQTNYAGGIIITDWYSPSSSNESIKISIFIYSDKPETNSFDVKSFKKICKTDANCTTTLLASEFNQSIKEKVLNKARSLSLKKNKQE